MPWTPTISWTTMVAVPIANQQDDLHFWYPVVARRKRSWFMTTSTSTSTTEEATATGSFITNIAVNVTKMMNAKATERNRNKSGQPITQSRYCSQFMVTACFLLGLLWTKSCPTQKQNTPAVTSRVLLVSAFSYSTFVGHYGSRRGIMSPQLHGSSTTMCVFTKVKATRTSISTSSSSTSSTALAMVMTDPSAKRESLRHLQKLQDDPLQKQSKKSSGLNSVPSSTLDDSLLPQHQQQQQQQQQQDDELQPQPQQQQSSYDRPPRTTSSSIERQQQRLMMLQGGDDLRQALNAVTQASLQRRKWARKQRDEAVKRRRKYKRKRIPESEQEMRSLRQERQAEYEQIVDKAGDRSPSIFNFDSLFPEPVWDHESIQRDLYEVRKRDLEVANSGALRNTRTVKSKTTNKATASFAKHLASSLSKGAASVAGSQPPSLLANSVLSKMRSSFYGGNAMMRVWREPRWNSAVLRFDETQNNNIIIGNNENATAVPTDALSSPPTKGPNPTSSSNTSTTSASSWLGEVLSTNRIANATIRKGNVTVDRDLTRMVEDRIYGYRRTQSGQFQYETSLMGDGAVQFRDGVRLGNPLGVNSDRLNYWARKELQHGRVEEAKELYEEAIRLAPRDGRAYLGLSKCAERRKDLKLARNCLQAGIANSVSVDQQHRPDRGANPFLLQALGCLEERSGHLSQAEALYISAVKSRPSHAAAWVALAQLRTRKLGQSGNAGRICYQAAERELAQAGLPPSSHVYTAWASLEYNKAGDSNRARELYKKALVIDPRCSAAWLQLGVMEANCRNWVEAQRCFDTVLQHDQRNSRVLQAYALMEVKRPGGNSRKALGMFERALNANPRDAGVLQAYALYVAQLGDIDAARELLRRGTEINKRHAAVWQAWGVLETRQGHSEEARKIFQQGIWACAQPNGGQSGGYDCSRLWQAWGVLEAQQGEYAAARRCFSRALDANRRSVPTVTAWALMEEKIGNIEDARAIYERALSKFAVGSSDKMDLWRCYELMEQRLGDMSAAQQVYQRAMREALAIRDDNAEGQKPDLRPLKEEEDDEESKSREKVRKGSKEVEVSRWESTGGEIWLNDKAIEGRVPFQMKNRKNKSS